MRNPARQLALALVGAVVASTVSVIALGAPAEAGTYCTAKQSGVRVYEQPRHGAPSVGTLVRGPEVGCGSTSNSNFAVIHRLDNGELLGYAYWTSLQRL